jgi:hypothetical protein
VSPKAVIGLIGVVTVAAFVAVIGAVLLANPTSVGPLGVTLWFVGVLVGLQGGFTLLLFAAKANKQQSVGPVKLLAASWRQGLLIALGLTIFLALSSLRQLGLRDVILISAVLALVEFYFRTRA